MDLSKFVMLKEIISADYLDNSAHDSIREVNSFLDNGWKLINTYTTTYDPELTPKHQKMHYVLGLPEDTFK